MQGFTSAHQLNLHTSYFSCKVKAAYDKLFLACLLAVLPLLTLSAVAQSHFAASSAAEMSAAASGAAQSIKGLIAGRVVDSQGAAVPGAQLKRTG